MAKQTLTKKQMQYGKNLKAVRLRANIPQQDVGDILGCAQSYISAMENGSQLFRQAFWPVLIKEFRKKYKITIDPTDFSMVD